MGRKKQQDKDMEVGAQLELIEVGPENLQAIKPIAKRYKTALQVRVKALQQEIAAKQQILALVKEAKLSRLADGSIRFKCDGLLITVTPRDELVKVKDENKEDGGE
jgi:hypothetical protein